MPAGPDSRIRVQAGTLVRQILTGQGISPLLVPMIFLDSRKVSVDTPLEADGILTLHGPLAGG
jgi:isocitrate dehydrogenase kinase/phosphatase